jgi:hypothetical protein
MSTKPLWKGPAGGKAHRSMIEVHLGHLIEYRSEDQPWRGLAPGRTRWEATYQIDTLILPAPTTGTTRMDLHCRTCGRPLTVQVHSRATLLWRFARLAVLAAAGGLAGYMMEGELWSAGLWALLTFYVAYFIQTNGGGDSDRVANLAHGSPAGHRLWGPGEDT